MTLDDLNRNFERHHDAIAEDIRNYVKSNGGCVGCEKRWHMRFLDSTDDQSYSLYAFDHIYINQFDECIVVYTEDTDLGECEVIYLSCDEMCDLMNDIRR